MVQCTLYSIHSIRKEALKPFSLAFYSTVAQQLLYYRQGRPCPPGGPKQDHFVSLLCGWLSSFATENKQLYAFITLTFFSVPLWTRLVLIIFLLLSILTETEQSKAYTLHIRQAWHTVHGFSKCRGLNTGVQGRKCKKEDEKKSQYRGKWPQSL